MNAAAAAKWPRGEQAFRLLVVQYELEHSVCLDFGRPYYPGYKLSLELEGVVLIRSPETRKFTRNSPAPKRNYMQMETGCFSTRYMTQNNAELVFPKTILLVELCKKVKYLHYSWSWNILHTMIKIFSHSLFENLNYLSISTPFNNPC